MVINNVQREAIVNMLSSPSICSFIDPNKIVGVRPIQKDDTQPFYANLIRKGKRYDWNK